MPSISLIVILLLLLPACYSTIYFKKLTLPAAILAGFVGFSIYLGAGLTGLSLLAAFFVLGTLATTWKHSYKQTEGLAERSATRRNAGQVFANGGVAALAAIAAYFLPEYTYPFQIIIASSLSAATADTLSSELGTLYGKRFYNILSFKNDKRGLDGVVSLEGFLIGIIGSAIIASIFMIGYSWSAAFFAIIIAGTIGNITDSLLGAALERRGIIKNDTVNFLNTLVGGLFGYLLLKLFITV